MAALIGLKLTFWQLQRLLHAHMLHQKLQAAFAIPVIALQLIRTMNLLGQLVRMKKPNRAKNTRVVFEA